MDGCGQLLNSFPTLRLKQEPSLASSKKDFACFLAGMLFDSRWFS